MYGVPRSPDLMVSPDLSPQISPRSQETDAWAIASNDRQRGVDWQFTIEDARHKLKSLYPKNKN